MKKVLLNWCPPAAIDSPSPSMSVLKAYLNKFNINVEVRYWNLYFNKSQQDFIFDSNGDESSILSLLYFYNYLAHKYKDLEAFNRIKARLIGLKPHYLNLESCFWDKHMYKYYEKLEEEIINEINSIELKNLYLIGFSMNLYQWIPATIISDIIKTQKKDIPIVIGGISTKEAAVSYLKNFTQFDIAIWGEGEDILLKITNYLDKNHKIDSNIIEIPNIAVRISDEVLVSDNINHDFSNLSDDNNRPNYEDYFLQINKYNIKEKIHLPIEGGRGCHWKKCNFCYLNTGYKYRTKDPLIIKSEIEFLINKYGIKTFAFLDNDVIGNDFGRFNNLLDLLIEIKNEFEDFEIIMAEIITKDIKDHLIKKMAIAGFQSVQIGYESASNNLLKKISKKNTFASNLFFIIQAIKYGILVRGANIIKGLIGETDSDILESIQNLIYLRFSFSSGKFYHHLSGLGICHCSRNFDTINSTHKFKHSSIEFYLPNKYLDANELENCFFTEKNLCDESFTWGSFVKVENYFLNSSFYYRLVYDKNIITYIEYNEEQKINILEFEDTSLEFQILQSLNNKIGSLRLLEVDLNNFTTEQIRTSLYQLNKEKIIYINDDLTEIVSIIDLNRMI